MLFSPFRPQYKRFNYKAQDMKFPPYSLELFTTPSKKGLKGCSQGYELMHEPRSGGLFIVFSFLNFQIFVLHISFYLCRNK